MRCEAADCEATLEAGEFDADGTQKLRNSITVADAAGLPYGDIPDGFGYPRFRWAFFPTTQLPPTSTGASNRLPGPH